MTQGILYGSKTYLCGNLENTKDAYKWRGEVAELLLKEIGVECFDPNLEHFINQLSETEETRNILKTKREEGDWDYLYNYMQSIVRRDLRYVDLSTFLICNLEPELATFGTTWELCVAHQQRKPVLFKVKDKSKFPLWLAGLFKSEFVWEEWDGLIQYLKDINSETIYANPKYWKILAKN